MKIKQPSKKGLRGFTFVELLMSVGIMMFMTGILFIRYPETIKRLTLSNIARNTGLLIREAQVRGSAVDSINSSVGGYGVYLSISKPNKLVLFGDVVDGSVSNYQISIGDGLYQTGNPIDETKTSTILPRGYTISKLCVGTSFPFSCNSLNSPAINSLTISFIRPDPLPKIYINDSKSVSYGAGCIELRSLSAPLSGHIKSVQFFYSGMIRTLSSPCDNNL